MSNAALGIIATPITMTAYERYKYEERYSDPRTNLLLIMLGLFVRASPDNGKPSGKVCPDCFKGNSLEECVSDQTRVCKHKEDKCVTYIGEFKDPDGTKVQLSQKGCMSPSICKHGFDLMIGFQEISSSGIHCT
ncbi:hypothetical protein FKM82_013009 [Ascaphus truei]